MSRPIKFRVWDLRNEAMYAEAYPNPNDCVSCRTASDAWGHIDNDRAILMQFTGLKDKIGVEIYEGDILTGGYPDVGRVEFGMHDTSTDYYASDAYGWFIRTKGDETYALHDGERRVIVGNIYQNPELLK
jgi:uncharacterized phage protein (TIGR01671 family)